MRDVMGTIICLIILVVAGFLGAQAFRDAYDWGYGEGMKQAEKFNDESCRRAYGIVCIKSFLQSGAAYEICTPKPEDSELQWSEGE